MTPGLKCGPVRAEGTNLRRLRSGSIRGRRRESRLERHTLKWGVSAFGACFLAVGLPYWRIPYSTASLPSSLMGPGLVVVGLAAFLLRGFRTTGFVAAALAGGLAVPAAIGVRVVVEASQDPTSHNLWPLEIVIALGVGGVCALPGALAGSVLSWLRGGASTANGGAS